MEAAVGDGEGEEGSTMMCGSTNCSGRGICTNGSCFCQIQFDGFECDTINLAYHVAFSSIFFLLALTSLLQLIMCVHAEYLRMKKNPSIIRACKITTQKLLYFLVFLAATLRGAYFAAPTLSAQWSISLLSAYYPIVLSGSSLIVCLWAEVFHLREIRWDRPRFLSKSFLGFLTFNVITYSLLTTELFLVWIEHENREFYSHIFNGCYAVLMFIVVIFFLIYGVEVFFKIRGGFAIPNVDGGVVISVNRDKRNSPIIRGQAMQPLMEGHRSLKKENQDGENAKNDEEEDDSLLANSKVRGLATVAQTNQMINTSQLHQSRLGLLSQALMMIVTVGFLFSETLEKFWKTKVDLTSRNTHDIIFRTVEIGIALWFPCVLWNCIRPEQLWCLNPKKILMRLPPLMDVTGGGGAGSAAATTKKATEGITDDDDDKSPECWICYDTDNCGPMITPCDCKGDVSSVHHDCLRRWLVESASDNPDALKCKVCNANYMVERGSQFQLSQGFTWRQWVTTASIITVMCVAMGGCWAVVQLYSQPWIRMLAVGSALLIQYICLRSLGLNTVTAVQRAKISALKIVNLKRQQRNSNVDNNGGRSLESSPHNLETLRTVQRSQTRF